MGSSDQFLGFSRSPEFLEVRNEFYKDTQGVRASLSSFLMNQIFLIYDVNSRCSFEQLDTWMKECSRFIQFEPIVVVCGNKVDKALPSNGIQIDLKRRVVTEKDGQE